MKTLVFFGSARRKGNTQALLDAFLEGLDHDADIIDAYRSRDIQPCRDCRYCWRKPGCSIQDSMQEIYGKIDASQLIVFASPVYFHSVSGPLKVIIDRMQTYWAGRIRKDYPQERKKRGVILLTGGAPPFTDQFTGAQLVLQGVLKDLGAETAGTVLAHTTDTHPVSGSREVLEEARRTAQWCTSYLQT